MYDILAAITAGASATALLSLVLVRSLEYLVGSLAAQLVLSLENQRRERWRKEVLAAFRR